MMTTLIPVLVALVGLLMYVLSSNAKVAELGRLMFMAAMFALTFAYATHPVRLP